jgi:hypothetical protein
MPQFNDQPVEQGLAGKTACVIPCGFDTPKLASALFGFVKSYF